MGCRMAHVAFTGSGVMPPCSKYKGRQRRACYATDEWKRPVRKKKAAKSRGRKK